MVDTVGKKTRSRMMSAIRAKNTRPEILVRSFLHRQGLRFRLHATELPGNPDLVFPKRNAVVFVDGCFWHRHEGCPKATTPSSRSQFWEEKFLRTRARDSRVRQELRVRGWKVLSIWECQTASLEALRSLAHEIANGDNFDDQSY